MSNSSYHFPHRNDRSVIQWMIDLRLSYAVISTSLVLLGFFWNNLEGFDWRYVVLVMDIFFANVFMFIVNDFYDAPHDSKDSIKKVRNLFCYADTVKLGKVILFTSLFLSLLLGVVVSISIFLIIVLFDLLAFFYSAPPIKLRNRLYWDWIFVFLWKGSIVAASYVYFFGADLSAGNSFMYGTLTIILLSSLISQLDNQIRDFNVDKTTNSGHSVQRLGHKKSSFLQFAFSTFFFAFSAVFCYIFDLYITVILILINVSLFYFVNPSKYSYVLEFVSIWVVVLFLEHFIGVFSYRQQMLFSAWIVVMLAIAIIHMKRIDLFEKRSGTIRPIGTSGGSGALRKEGDIEDL